MHASFRRNIIRRNPKRYDEDGDELDTDDEDKQADAEAAQGNPYAEIKLESEDALPMATQPPLLTPRANRSTRAPDISCPAP